MLRRQHPAAFPPPGATPHPGKARPGSTRSDFELLRDVQAILADPLRSPADHDVTASVREGVVTLRGTTAYPSDRAVLRRVVGRIPGVVAVGCDLTARDPEPSIPRTRMYEPAWT
jgi:osmotically-inducible protein OsmY